MALKKPEDFKGSALNVYTYDDSQQRIKDQMNQNSAAWWEADDVGKKTLEQANKSLAAQLGGNIGYSPQTGTWAGVSNMPTSMKTGVDMAKPSFDVNSYLASNPAPTFDINAYLGSNPKPTWESQYSGRIDAMLNQIMNREDFSYDLESDPLWSTYKTQYNREGTRAMNDTLAAAAAGAGGMNSYAIGAAQQANNYHNAQLMDRIPELYQLAYSMYMDDLNAQRVDLSTLMNMDDVDYGRYRDNVGDWYTDLSFNYGAYRDNRSDWENDRNFAYTDYRDKMGDYEWGTSFNYEAEQNQLDRDFEQMKWDYGVAQDEYEKGQRQTALDTESQRYGNETAYDRAMEMLLLGVMPNATLLSQAGITDAEAKSMLDKVNMAELGAPVVGSTGGGGGGSDTGGGDDKSDAPEKTGGSYNNGKLTSAQVKELQNALGVSADGLYGEKSKAAAGGLSADAAYAKFVHTPQWEEEQNVVYDDGEADVEVANAHGDSWVAIPMKGRMTWQEVESYVNSGKIKEEKTADGKLRYTWVG